MHQQNQPAAGTVRLPLCHDCTWFLSAQDLEQLDQGLYEVIDAVRTDPCGTEDHTGNNFENAISEVDELFKVQLQRKSQFLAV